MAYNTVSRPRFIIDAGLYLHTVGHSTTHWRKNFEQEDATKLIHLNPTNGVAFGGGSAEEELDYAWLEVRAEYPMNYVAVLGHNMASAGGKLTVSFSIGHDEDTMETDSSSEAAITEIVNFDGQDQVYDGFSICSFVDNPTYNYVRAKLALAEDSAGFVSAISIGCTYLMPHAPDLALTLSREYGKAKNYTTINGSSVSNTMWLPRKWNDLGAWELSDPAGSSPNQSLADNSRRIWKLNFSYLDDGDVFGANQSLTAEFPDGLTQTYDTGDLASDVAFSTDILGDSNFFSQVWHKTLGGTLPFMFQPDKDVASFAICRFRNNSLKVTQSAFNVYDISITIEETF